MPSLQSALRQGSGNIILPAFNIPAGVQHVLVLEDNFLIALEAEFILNTLGVGTVHIASTVQDAILIVNEARIDFALLDVQLGNENSFGFAAFLKERGVPFGFCSGYGEDVIVPVGLGEVVKIAKPFDAQSVAGLLLKAAPNE